MSVPLRYLCFLVIAVLLVACAPSYAPVVDRYGAEAASEPVTEGVHLVRKGETLYSIAWRYGWDFRRLAAANGVTSPYTIYPGQEIRLDRRPAGGSATARPAAKQPDASSTSKPAPPARPAPTRKPATDAGPVGWQWPARGALLAKYVASVAGQQGIAIGGGAGDPVTAAASGVVVYRGNGLTGYGNLLIIKHNERWLSAYAHTREMLVREGEAVKGGQRIATIGDTGTFRTQLHFEIRRDGAPIDPLTVLPER